MFLGYKLKSDLDKHVLRLRQCWESLNDLWRFPSLKPVNWNIGRISLNEAREVPRPHHDIMWSTSTGCSCTRLTGTSMACNVLDGEARTGERVAPWMNLNGRLWRSFDYNNLLAHTINVCYTNTTSKTTVWKIPAQCEHFVNCVWLTGWTALARICIPSQPWSQPVAPPVNDAWKYGDVWRCIIIELSSLSK